MLIDANREFADYVELIYRQQKEERVHCFEYKGNKYWLKQPEHPRGIERLLKARPKQLFQNELRTLLYLENKRAPVPHLLVATDHYFVLEDAGETLNHLLPIKSAVEKQQILQDVVIALTNLHKMDLVHGRPAIRDIAWDNGIVRFIDFENHAHTRDLTWKKMRDILVFMHSLCRTKDLTDKDILSTIRTLEKTCETRVWTKSRQFLMANSWLYYLLLPFKVVAGTDLLAFYRLFECVRGTK